ncbi:hypothetical protein [Shewanella atlantica]|uniref:hypothetical protein n=1 Tax=Shewanella atlantica TaxID=271099 RepID=UPI0037367323
MLRSVLLVSLLSLGLMGCGGGSDEGADKKPDPDKNGGKVNPILIDRYPEGLYFISLAEDAGDIVRGAIGDSKYVGVGFAYDIGMIDTQVLQASVSEVGQDTHRDLDWFKLAAKASKTNKFNHDVYLNYCQHDGLPFCFPSASNTELGDRLLKPISSVHKAQLVANQFASGISPVFSDKGFTMETDLSNSPSLLFVQVESKPLNVDLVEGLVGSIWHAPAEHLNVSNYSRYSFSKMPDGGLSVQASIMDENNMKQCTVSSRGSFNALQNRFMRFDAEMTAEMQVSCQDYLSSIGQVVGTNAKLELTHEILIGFIKDANGAQSMALRQVVGEYSVAGNGLFVR